MKFHFPSIVKRGIMRAIALVCNVKESAVMYRFWKELIHTVALIFVEYAPGSPYHVPRSLSYRHKNVIINSLECYIGNHLLIIYMSMINDTLSDIKLDFMH